MTSAAPPDPGRRTVGRPQSPMTLVLRPRSGPPAQLHEADVDVSTLEDVPEQGRHRDHRSGTRHQHRVRHPFGASLQLRVRRAAGKVDRKRGEADAGERHDVYPRAAERPRRSETPCSTEAHPRTGAPLWSSGVSRVHGVLPAFGRRPCPAATSRSASRSGVTRQSVSSRRPWRMISWAAPNGIR